MSDTAIETPAAQGQLNTKSKSQVVVKYEAAQVYFRPDTGEIIFVPQEDAAEFEAHGFAMTKMIHDLHKANQKVSQCVAAYGEVMTSPDPQLKASAQKAYEKAVAEQKKAADVVKATTDKLDPLAKLASGGSSIVELIPLSKNSATGKSRQYNRKIVHVKSNNINKRGWRAFPLDQAQRKALDANGAENLLKEVNGKKKIDWEKLGKQLKDFKPEVKVGIWEKKWAEGVLFEWAEAMNKEMKGEMEGLPGGYLKNHVDLSAQAQMMRYLAATGVESAWDPKAGKLGLKAEAKAEFSLAEAKASMKVFAPHRLGWVLHFTSPTSGAIYPLGALRAQLELVAAGVCGASLMVELSSEIECSKLKVGIKGISSPGTPPPPVNPLAGPNVSGTEVKVAPVKMEAGAFAGVKADVDLAGSLQWKNPEAKGTDFEDFIKIAPGVSAMAGIGGNGKLEISYRNGKFVMVVQASLCLGLGARGKLACETDAKKIGTFVYWFFYQLYHANFEFLVFITREAFKAMQDLQFLVIQSGKQIGQFMYDSYADIDSRVRRVLLTMENSEARNELAERILANPDMLRISTPETKGMLLYQLTRHGKADWVDSDNYQRLDAYGDRKRAVLFVLQHVQTLREWSNVFQHMHPRGEKTNGSHYLTVERFLQLGHDEMDDDMKRIKERLKRAPARGYAVVPNNSQRYAFRDADNPQFAYASVEPLSPLDVSHYA